MTVTTSGTHIIGGVLAHLAAGAVAILFACAAAAQGAPQLGVAPATESQPLPPQAEPQPRAKPPGLFGTIGRWVDDSIAGMSSGWRNARTAVGDLGDQATGAAKDAAGAARDAAALCKAKGYTTGTSLHIQSEQKCPVWGWIAGEKPIGRCAAETYVTSAMCR